MGVAPARERAAPGALNMVRLYTDHAATVLLARNSIGTLALVDFRYGKVFELRTIDIHTVNPYIVTLKPGARRVPPDCR